MAEEYGAQQFFGDVNTRLRDIEEKQRLLKDRTLLIGQNLVKEREETFNELQDLKKLSIALKEEVRLMKEKLDQIIDQMGEVARKEEVMIIQRQLDILKPHI